MKRFLTAIFTGVCLFLMLGHAMADQETATMTVTTTIVSPVTVSATTLDFGSFDNTADVNAESSVTVTAGSGVNYKIHMDAGLHLTFGYRNVELAGGSLLQAYQVFKDSARSQEWGDSDGANTYAGGTGLADTGNGAAQPHTVYGTLYSGGTPAPGVYSDTVTITVEY